VEVSGADVERWAEATAAAHGFVDVTHTVEIFGTCHDCATRPAPARPAGHGSPAGQLAPGVSPGG
jgi:Fur family ferric uptake transcriptional regulator